MVYDFKIQTFIGIPITNLDRATYYIIGFSTVTFLQKKVDYSIYNRHII